jgi:hypothetical protein
MFSLFFIFKNEKNIEIRPAVFQPTNPHRQVRRPSEGFRIILAVDRKDIFKTVLTHMRLLLKVTYNRRWRCNEFSFTGNNTGCSGIEKLQYSIEREANVVVISAQIPS